jgi:hypothetical protein
MGSTAAKWKMPMNETEKIGYNKEYGRSRRGKRIGTRKGGWRFFSSPSEPPLKFLGSKEKGNGKFL